MDILNLVGEGEDLTMLQMSIRTFGMFIIMLALVRMAGLRTFAKKSSFDNVVVIMLGAILARGVVGASPYWATVAAAIVMVLLHRVIAWLTVKNRKFEKLIKGDCIQLYANGKTIHKNLNKTGLSNSDLHESLRLETKKINFENIQAAFMETDGRISFIVSKDT